MIASLKHFQSGACLCLRHKRMLAATFGNLLWGGVGVGEVGWGVEGVGGRREGLSRHSYVGTLLAQLSNAWARVTRSPCWTLPPARVQTPGFSGNPRQQDHQKSETLSVGGLLVSSPQAHACSNFWGGVEWSGVMWCGWCVCGGVEREEEGWEGCGCVGVRCVLMICLSIPSNVLHLILGNHVLVEMTSLNPAPVCRALKNRPISSSPRR